MIPLLDVVAHHQPILPELEAAALRVIRSGRYILGPEVEELEKELSAAIGGGVSTVAVSSGTDALLEVFMALRLGSGDEVVTTPFTFFATAGTVARVSAKPVFVDIDPVTFNLDVSKVEAAIGPRTKAIEPVHLFGQCCDLGALEEISKRRNVPLVEDACQAIGAKWNGRAAGTVGLSGCFSFFPSKNLGGLGDSGAITTTDPEFATRLRALRVHGGLAQYRHEEVGGNFRIDALQAALLRVKLPHLPEWEAGRRRNADRYRELFAAAKLDEVVLPTALPAAHHVYNQFVIRVPRRDDLAKALSAAGIGNAVYYPRPLHLQDCFRDLGHREGDFPEAERACREVLALPIYPELTAPQQEQVVAEISRFFGRG